MNVISQLFKRKYAAANRMSAGKMRWIGAGRSTSGAMPETRKKRFADSHADAAGADILNRALCGSLCRFAIQNEMTKPSSATRTVPAAGPYSSTAVNTNVSDIDIEAYVDGKRTVADPLTRVRPAMMNHWDSIGCRSSPKIELVITPTPTEMTVQRKTRPSRDNFRLDATFRRVYRSN